jgi:hypothetical protein
MGDLQSEHNEESRQLRIQTDREWFKQQVPAIAEERLRKLDAPARQRVCIRTAEVLDRFEDNFLSAPLGRVIFNVVAEEFVCVSHDADFEAGLVSAYIFTALVLPHSRSVLNGAAKEINARWRDERAKLQAEQASNGRLTVVSAQPPEQPERDGDDDEAALALRGMDPIAEKRQQALNTYKDEVQSAGRKQPTDTDIAVTAGWKERSPVTWWKRNDERCTPAMDSRIRKVLREKPHLK